MIALDTNILVCAHREGPAYHEPAINLVRNLSEGRRPYGLFWPSPYEFPKVVTHNRLLDPPSTVEEALDALEAFLWPPTVRLLAETPSHEAILKQVLRESKVEGNLIHDAHLVALALEHGVREILTLDSDFKRVPQVLSRSPF